MLTKLFYILNKRSTEKKKNNNNLMSHQSMYTLAKFYVLELSMYGVTL